MAEPPKGLFSLSSLGRRTPASRSASETIAHPLLGASSSSLSLVDPSASASDSDGAMRSSDLPSTGLPYRPRQRRAPSPTPTPVQMQQPQAGAAPGSPSAASATGTGTGTASTSTSTSTITVTTSATAGHFAPSSSTTSSPSTSHTITAYPPLPHPHPHSPVATTSMPATPALAAPAAPTTSPAFAHHGELPDMSLGLGTSGAGSASATRHLQLQSLKAAAQKIGLGNGSMGMGMIDSIFEKGARVRGEGGDWADLLKVLTSGKAIILLPASPASSLPMTPQTLRDHVAFLSPPIAASSQKAGTPSSGVSVFVTLSGLIGTLKGTTVAFESSVPADSPLIAALREGSQRPVALSTLRPTQLAAPPTATPPSSPFPTYTLSADSTLLPFPPLGRGAPPSSLERHPKEPAPRRINPFASLFGGSGAGTASSSSAATPLRGGLSPERPGSPSPGTSQLSSPRPSITSLDPDAEAGEGYSVMAYTINRPVRFTEVHKTLVKAVRSMVRVELEGLPDKVIEKVLRLVLSAVCPVSGSAADQALLKSHHHGLGTDSDAAVPLDFSDPTTCGERLQDFMEAIYDDLIIMYRADASSGKKVPWARDAADKDDKESSESREAHAETAASEGTERVEAVICRLLYNRIFSPLQSDDARHDEALASRIAALNLLDLSLDHLGLITRPRGETPRGALAKGLTALVGDIGEELQKLSTLACLTPRDKSDVLVRAHKIAVDGLARLPPIDLRPEGEPYIPSAEEEDEAEGEELSTITEGADGDPEAEAEEDSEAPLVRNVPDLVLPGSPQTIASAELCESPATELGSSIATVVPGDKGAGEGSAEKSTGAGQTSGADLILPLIIYAVVRANPAQLASQLMYLRRYRSAICLVGEASYAIVNLTAVVEFLEHVHLADLGLGDDSDRVMSVEDLSPIGLYLDDANADAASIASASSRLRGRVFQVGEFAGDAVGSANKVITGVVDSSWSALRGFIGGDEAGGPGAPGDKHPYPASTNPNATANNPTSNLSQSAPTNIPGRPRQSSTFSLANVTASVAHIAAAATTAAARTRSRASSHASEWGTAAAHQEMVEVAPSSRPASVRGADIYIDPDHVDSDDSPRGSGSSQGQAQTPAPAPAQPQAHTSLHPDDGGRPRSRSDARSIMSVSSMMKKDDRERDRDRGRDRDYDRERDRDRARGSSRDRSAIGTRLASIAGGGFKMGEREGTPPVEPKPLATQTSFFAALTSRGAPGARRASTLSVIDRPRSPGATPSPTVPALPLEDPPMERFMTCEVGDIRLSEIGTLLRDYRRLAGVISRMQSQGQGPPHA